jgi:AcrR family transcriptional regulator
MTDRPYHHGDLRRELLRQAAAMIEEVGPTHVSLRELARRAGVSHAAPAHHFRDKAGLLTAIATEGFLLLADRLTDAMERTGDFLEVGVAYVDFAVAHRAHFEVMFRPDLYDADADDVRAARAQSSAALYGGVRAVPRSADGPDTTTAGLAAWSIVHGFASLWIAGALPPVLGPDAALAARRVAGVLFLRPDTGPGPVRQADDDRARR